MYSFIVKCIVALTTSFLLLSCTSKKETKNWKDASWPEIAKAANGTTVNFMMWQGSSVINNYMNNYVVPELKKQFNINLKISSGQGPEIVQLVMGEKEAGVMEGQIDVVWINGETFFQLKKISGLWGPFVQKLPHATFIDFIDPAISIDFQQPINNMECPWGISQFALVYDSARVSQPPKNLAELEKYVQNYPGTFTISNDFSGMSLLKSFLAELSGSPGGLNGAFNEEKYKELSAQLWKYLNSNKKYFWKQGATFPKEHSKMDQLFASGELNITFGFSEGGIEEKVEQGLYPKTTRGYAWKNGTVMNSNYLGILDNAKQKAGAMQVINFLISPEAQYKKANPEGMNANTVLAIDKLPEEWQTKFKAIVDRKYGPTLNDLAPYAIQEPAPEYMIRLFEDFRTFVIEK